MILELKNVLDRNGVPIVSDPTTVVVEVTDPAGTTVSYTLGAGQVVKDSVGNYHYDLATAGVTDAQLGYWIYTWQTTGTPQHADTNVFILKSDVKR